MQILPLDIHGAFHILPEPFTDGRGSFSRLTCRESFARHGIGTDWVQTNTSFTRERGTVRGLHYQTGAAAEDKLVCCLAGAAFDVLVDLRRHSPTFGQWRAVELSAERRDSVFLPAGLAHGFQALRDGTLLHYSHSQAFAPDRQGGLHHADPDLSIPWPLPVRNLSERDAQLPNLASLAECPT